MLVCNRPHRRKRLFANGEQGQRADLHNGSMN
jgi:hypothetical protein